jgi:hypothetical protein
MQALGIGMGADQTVYILKQLEAGLTDKLKELAAEGYV